MIVRVILQDQTMGGSVSESFVPHDWKVLESTSERRLLQHHRHPQHRIEEYEVRSGGQAQLALDRSIFDLRRTHPQLVAGYFFEEEGSGGICSTSYSHRLFIEETPIRLCDVGDIPFPDFLHVYDQCLTGFKVLAGQVGCFEVEEEHIAINGQGVVKVWMNQDYSKNHILGRNISEPAMVRCIVETIDQNLDHNGFRDVKSIKDHLYSRGQELTFIQAQVSFYEYVRQYYGGRVPRCLESIKAAGGPHFIARHQRQIHGQSTPPRQPHAPTIVSQIIESQPAHNVKHTRQSSSAKVEKQWSTPQSPVRPPPTQAPFVPEFNQTPKVVKAQPQIIERPRSVSDAPIMRLPSPTIQSRGLNLPVKSRALNVPVQSQVHSNKSQSTAVAQRKSSAPTVNLGQPSQQPTHQTIAINQISSSVDWPVPQHLIQQKHSQVTQNQKKPFPVQLATRKFRHPQPLPQPDSSFGQSSEVMLQQLKQTQQLQPSQLPTQPSTSFEQYASKDTVLNKTPKRQGKKVNFQGHVHTGDSSSLLYDPHFNPQGIEHVEDMGRVVASNVVSPSDRSMISGKAASMLKVGRNLEMKYSVVESDENTSRAPESVPRPFFASNEGRKYNMNLDPELAADLNRLRNS